MSSEIYPDIPFNDCKTVSEMALGVIGAIPSCKPYFESVTEIWQITQAFSFMVKDGVGTYYPSDYGRWSEAQLFCFTFAFTQEGLTIEWLEGSYDKNFHEQFRPYEQFADIILSYRIV